MAVEDCLFYLEKLKDWKGRLGIRLYRWCLVTNHIHLLSAPTRAPETLSELMKNLAGRQVAHTYKQEGRRGSPWEGRFKASPAQRDSYLLSCKGYFEMNPVTADMVLLPEAYRWSSNRERFGQEYRGLLDYNVCYLGFGSGLNIEQRREHYRSYLFNSPSPEEQLLIQSGVGVIS